MFWMSGKRLRKRLKIKKMPKNKNISNTKPQIQKLLLESLVLSKKNKNELTNLLDELSESELKRLYTILDKEKAGIADILAKKLQADGDWLIKLNNLIRKEKSNLLVEQEKTSEKEEVEELKNLDTEIENI